MWSCMPARINHHLCLIRGKCRSSECPEGSYRAPADQVWLLQHHHPGRALQWGHGLLHHVPGSHGLTKTIRWGKLSCGSGLSKTCTLFLTLLRLHIQKCCWCISRPLFFFSSFFPPTSVFFIMHRCRDPLMFPLFYWSFPKNISLVGFP